MVPHVIVSNVLDSFGPTGEERCHRKGWGARKRDHLVEFCLVGRGKGRMVMVRMHAQEVRRQIDFDSYL